MPISGQPAWSLQLTSIHQDGILSPFRQHRTVAQLAVEELAQTVQSRDPELSPLDAVVIAFEAAEAVPIFVLGSGAGSSQDHKQHRLNGFLPFRPAASIGAPTTPGLPQWRGREVNSREHQGGCGPLGLWLLFWANFWTSISGALWGGAPQ
jgi:hypothetical protein